RDLPGRIAPFAIRRVARPIALLREEGSRRLALFARKFDSYEWDSRSIEERRRDRPDLLVGRLAQCAEQVGRRGAAMLVPFDVGADAVSEGVRAQPALQHPEDGCALDVRYAVEHLLGLARIDDGLTDRSRRVERIFAHDPALRRERLQTSVHGRAPLV